jgi:hypothetical protein
MRHSYTRDVLALLTARPGEWFDGLALARIGGAYASRTRISEARIILETSGRGTIENRLVRHGKRVESLYRFVPSAPSGQIEMFG